MSPKSTENAKKAKKPPRGETNPNAVLKEISAKIIKMDSEEIRMSNKVVEGVYLIILIFLSFLTV